MSQRFIQALPDIENRNRDEEDHSPQLEDHHENEGQKFDNVASPSGTLVNTGDVEYYKKLQKEKQNEEIKEISKNIWFSRILVQYTSVVLVISLVLALVFSVIAIALGGFELSEDHERNYMIWSSKQVQEWDMLELAIEKVQTNYPDGVQPLRTTIMNDWTTSVTFE
jgi:hypothetical protein